jgi:hypothetical protein
MNPILHYFILCTYCTKFRIILGIAVLFKVSSNKYSAISFSSTYSKGVYGKMLEVIADRTNVRKEFL